MQARVPRRSDFDWVRLCTCTHVARRGPALAASPYGAEVHVRLVQAAEAVERSMPSGVHRDERCGVARVDQPQRRRQQRGIQRVVSDQPRLVRRATQESHYLTPFRRIVDLIDPRQVLLRGDREQLGRPGKPACHGQLQGAAPRRVEASQDNFAESVVAKPHCLIRTRLHHEQTLGEGGRQPLVHDGRRYAGGGAQHATSNASAKARHCLDHLLQWRWHALNPGRQQPGDVEDRLQVLRARPPRPIATRQRLPSTRGSNEAR